MGESRGLAYVPALDGIRALSVLLVMAFHLEVAGFAGGFLPVSLFFTLSGYLITQLILDEFDSTGRFSLLDFWSRRFRRLMPAALLGIAIVAGLAVAIESLRSPRLRGDLGAALGYVANWRFASSSQTYADLFSNGASPVQHFWSLAIEEQFYVVFPLLMAGLLVRARRSVGFVLAGLMVTSVVAGLLADSRNLIYYGTHVRAAELLAGAVLATLLPIGRAISTRVAKAFAIAASAGVVALGVAVATVSIDDGIVYSGGLAAFSLVSVAVILGSLVPGPVNWLMSRRPLVAIGRVSYGLYVFHWPVIVVLDEQRMGFGGFGLVLVRVAVTVAITVLSYFLIENPVRRRRVLVGFRRAATAAGGAVVAVVATILIVPQFTVPVLAGLDAPDEVVSFGQGEPTLSDGIVVDAAPVTTVPVADIRVAVLGDMGRDLPATLPDGRTVEFVSGLPERCPLRAGSEIVDGCPSIAAALASMESVRAVDLVVATFGSNERLLHKRLIGDQSARLLLERPEWRDRKYVMAAGYLSSVVGALGDRPTLFVDSGPIDELSSEIDQVVARERSIVGVAPGSEDVGLVTAFESLAREVEFPSADARKRVLVIGDSTSFGLAQALDAVAGSSLDILWAGGRNCPLAPVETVRWWGGVEFDVSACPRVDPQWTTALTEFEPNLVLLVYSVPQQSEQRYEPDGKWFKVGDAEFEARQRATLETLFSVGSTTGSKFAFLSSPRVYGGTLGAAPFSSKKRIDAWNKSIQSYVAQWPDASIIDWAAFVIEAEENAGGRGSLRPDGVHLELADLEVIAADRLVPAINQLLSPPAP